MMTQIETFWKLCLKNWWYHWEIQKNYALITDVTNWEIPKTLCLKDQWHKLRQSENGA